jgi:hypothetical protein
MKETLETLIAQCIKDNPEMTSTINGESVKLEKDEYEQAVKDWATMRLAQLEFEAKQGLSAS